MNLLQELRKFDGQHVAALESLAVRLPATDACVNELIALSNQDDARMQTAATWLLKRLQEKEGALLTSQTRELLHLLGVLQHWEGLLHLLQILPKLEIPARQAPRLHRILVEHSRSANKLVRAWSYNGLAVLADQHGRFRESVRGGLIQAEQDAAASVRARIRNVRKSFRWIDERDQETP